MELINKVGEKISVDELLAVCAEYSFIIILHLLGIYFLQIINPLSTRLTSVC